MADVLSSAVAAVTAVLRRDLFTLPLAGLQFTPAGRVTPYPPSAVTAPCVFLAAASGSARYDESSWATVIDVVCVADGGNDQGWELLYELTDRVVSLLSSRVWLDQPAPDSRVVGARSRPLDVGGPSLRGFEVTVELYAPHPTFCSDTLTLPITRLEAHVG
jgi:hypothetical protein